jgi:cytochrome c-type biogenesis protein CcmE
VKRYDKLVLLLLLAVFAVGGYRTIISAMTPYVSFAYAEQAAKSVQVKGYPIEGSIMLLENEAFSFVMEDLEGGNATIYHKGTIPQNLMEAESVVVVGRFEDGGFVAQNILVKCPSKYQAQQ